MFREKHEEDKNLINAKLEHFENETKLITAKMKKMKEEFFNFLQNAKTFFKDSKIIKKK